MSGAFFRGTSLAQDQRFGDATQKLIAQTTFSSILKKRIDMAKVNMQVIKPWISQKINSLLGIEDDVLFEYVVNMLEESDKPDGKAMQVNLTGFLESKTEEFMQSLWSVLLEAQKGPGGIPESLIRGKVQEMKRERVEQVRMREAIRMADARAREGTGSRAAVSERRTKSGRKSRWDTPSMLSLSVQTAPAVESRRERDRDRDQDQGSQHRSKRNRSASPARGKQSAIDRLSVSGSTVSVRSDVEFALGIVNQCNQLFSKQCSEIKRQIEASVQVEGVERMMRIALAAFRFLDSNRSVAGFAVLGLEKTMSNFTTACANAHLGTRAWDSLALLRQWLLEHAERHIVAVNGVKPEAGRAVRKPATKLCKDARAPARTTSERLAAGMRRLSIVREAGSEVNSVAHFPISYSRGDTSFNVLVVTLLCNVLRVLSQAPSAPKATEAMPQLGVRAHSALEWSLRLLDVDSAAADPFLGACFRAYYALGSSSGSLDIRVLGLAAYASTKACNVRELLRYAVRAAERAESLATAGSADAYRPIATYYAAVAELARPLLASVATITPEMVDVCHRRSEACRGMGDLKGALEVCSQVAATRNRDKDSHAELVACSLGCNCLVQDALTLGEQCGDMLAAAERMAALAETALGRSARHTLVGWNTLAMCADMSRKAAKRVVAEMRGPRLGAVRDCVAGAVVRMLDTADRIYEAYVSRGAALKAQEAGGSSLAVLRSHSAEVCVLAVQLAEHDAAAVARHSGRLLQLCSEPGCVSLGFLRSHSTVMFNRGANLYQLKSHGPAALAMEHAIDSLSLWVALASDASTDVAMQLCKRYEIAALASQAGGSYLRASQVLGRAVAWLAGQPGVVNAVVAKPGVLPVGSSVARASGLVERLLMFVDRYVRMCAARLARDPSEPQAQLSLLGHITEGQLTASAVLRAWLYEAEAFHWRPFAAALSAPYALDVRASRLQCALQLYTKAGCALGHSRCLVELAKVDRDRACADQAVSRLNEAAGMNREPPCVYSLTAGAECHAWLAIVAVERDHPYAEHLKQSMDLWTRACQVAEAGDSLDTGHLLGAVVDTMNHIAELLMSRRMHAAALDVLQPTLAAISLCESHDRPACAPLAMQALVDLATASLLLGQTNAAAEHFRHAAERYEQGVLPMHVDVASKIAFAMFCLACSDDEEGARLMRNAAALARCVLETDSAQRSARSKRPVVSPDSMLLFSRASHAYSVLSLKQGALADAVDFALHSYRVLNSLLRSLAAAHARAKQDALGSQSKSNDDPFATESNVPANNNNGDDVDDDDDDHCQFVAFSANWVLQRLLIENLAHLSELYSLRGSVREAEYFLRKALAISARLHAPRQEALLRLLEADILARKNMRDECVESLLTKVQPLNQVPHTSRYVELDSIRALVVEGDSWRRANRYDEAAGAYTRAQEMLSHIAADNVPLQVLAEDLAVRQRLLASNQHDDEPPLGAALARRCIDQRPEHLLMKASVAFAKLQKILASEPTWSSVLQSALVFPALRCSQTQRPRKGSPKALARDCLAELDALLIAAAESAITVGSAHCVHESCHLLALTRALTIVFGLSSIGGMDHWTLASIVDDARNITAVREAVDVIRRTRNALPASLMRWPSDALDPGRDELHRSPQSSPSLKPRRSLRQTGMLSSPSMDRRLLFDPRGKDEVEEDLSASTVDYFGHAMDGSKVVAGWTAVPESRQTLRDCLPPSWVACSISIDTLRNVLFVTRYERHCDPLVVCLPMREIRSESASRVPSEGVFDDLLRKLASIIAESDRSMKTGGSCTTEDEKRKWWDLRSELDRQLGHLLQCVETEWLGGFKDVLLPDSPPLALGDYASAAEVPVDVELLRRDIQQCVSGCLPKAFAAKARSMELSDQLCMLVLAAATRIEEASDDGDSEWLDVCSMIWDVYCYQGAAPSDPSEELQSSFADTLRQAIAGYVEAAAVLRQKTDKKQLILVSDKHAQQVPWECLPCLRDCPISRVPSVAFLQNSIAAAKNSRSALARTAGAPSSTPGGLMALLGGASGSQPPMLADYVAGPLMPMSLPLLASAAGGRTSKRAPPPKLASTAADTLTALVDIPSGAATADGTHVFYVLNPEGDLHRTQANFEEYLRGSGQRHWHGVIGRRPTPHECESGLSSSDIFMYFGHGGAENYISRTQIRGLFPRCSVALLFGCSSGQLKPAGEYDATGTAIDYLIAGCPALVGNLWDVGDKDIDRFAARLLSAWGLDRMSAGEIAVKSVGPETAAPSRPMSLAEAVCEARKACRMSFLTGAAPVVYGIPAYLS
ncbi:separin protein [Coemansia sp. BCRC 34301]|nr:separin protein [Coemansia sp. BCRC 34301]